jgi:formate dehydrogenase subunit gamma
MSERTDMTRETSTGERSDQDRMEGWIRSAAKARRGEAGPLLPLLHDVQGEFGYLPQGCERILADELNLSRADVHGVIGFYRDFRRTPPARVAVRICRAEACQAVGADALVGHVKQRVGIGFGEVTVDTAASLDQVFCFGNCALGPTVEIAGRLHGRVDGARFDQLFADALAVGGAP